MTLPLMFYLAIFYEILQMIRSKIGMYFLKFLHPDTLAIWKFTVYKISCFVSVILKGNFKKLYRSKVSLFWSENSDLLFSFSFYFLLNLSNPVFFAHCCCYYKELKYLNCNLMQPFVNSINSLQKTLDLTTPAKNNKKMRIFRSINWYL